MSQLPDDILSLQAENARLIALLEANGIAWQVAEHITHTVNADDPPTSLSTAEKIALFRQRFRGRTDIHPVRWESTTSGKTGYSPACSNEWKPGVCEKPRIKCGDCQHRAFVPLSDVLIYRHLAGEATLGVYPLLADDTCYFLAVDFDKAHWREDIVAFADTCRELSVPVSLEISRSGNGAHAWIFFSDRVPACDARRLGTALLSYTCQRTRQLNLSSYDRLFPNQDTLPKAGFGNLIALPLQKLPRESGYSVFVDDTLQPYADQWAYLNETTSLAVTDVEPLILQASGSQHPLDVTFIDEHDLATPWARQPSSPAQLPGPLPARVTLTLSNLIYLEKAALTQPLMNRLIRLAAFQNPEFYKAQAMRLSVWDKPRVIGCAENYPQHIALPRGCLDAIMQVLQDNGIECDIQDERHSSDAPGILFRGTLRADQDAAVRALLEHDIGVLCAPTAFGKTVIGAAMIAHRAQSTLILVHRTELLRQWQERLSTWLDVDATSIGTLGGGKRKLTGVIDIAVVQSLSRKGKIDAVVEDYAHVIIDECHHVGAVSFEALLKRVKARFVLGLTATPIRRDGQQPIIFMQCGPIRHTAVPSSTAPQNLEVIARPIPASATTVSDEQPIQALFRQLVENDQRTGIVADETARAFHDGRKVLVLTERTDHLTQIHNALVERGIQALTLQGRMSKKAREVLMVELESLAPDAPRILLATGRLVGEGFDHPPLDTLVLAMPVSWKGTLQQYAGRLHREHSDKHSVRIIDLIDTDHPALVRMWNKRQKGYRAMGYRISDCLMS